MGVKETEIDQQVKARENYLNPFPGLRPFGFDESHLFFGREGQSDDILIKLANNRFVGVIGASGSGKSSLMYCGLIPVLYGGFMTSVGPDWVVISTRPGNSPLENLAESILRLDKNYDKLPEHEKHLELTLNNIILKSSSMGLVDVLKKYATGQKRSPNFLILIDQFEELFRFLKRENDIETANISASFVNLLIRTIQQNELPVYVAITMRSDYIGDCAQFPDLTQIINSSHYLIPQMTRDQQKMAIEGPIAVGGGKITRRLTQQLLNDVGNRPDQLPILQHALMRTWDYWVHNREEGEPIDLRHYIAVGRLEEALSQHANETYSELNKNEREVCEVIFKSLTEKGRDNYGIRRPAKISELAKIANVHEKEIIKVVEKFRQPGRSILMPPAQMPLRSDTIIEISHESLMRIWDRLKNWVDEEFESAQMYRRLSDAAAMYQVGRTGLWRPPDLQLALNWQKKQIPSRAWAQRYNPVFERAILFLETSKTAYENEQRSKELLQRNMLRKARNMAVVFGFLSIIAIVFFVFALIKKVDADEKAMEALANAERIGFQREIAVISAKNATMASYDAQSKSRLATIREQQARDAQADALDAQADAIIQRLYAEEQARIAEIRREEAQLSAIEAEQAKSQAERAALEEQRQRSIVERLNMLNIAQAMAAKSLQIRDEQLRGLVALQANIFNIENGGILHDRYIYDGLYYALKNLAFAEKDSLYAFHGHSGIVRGVEFSKNGNNVYSAATDGKIYRWDFQHVSKPPAVIQTNNSRNRMIKTSPDGRWLVVISDQPVIQCFDMNGNGGWPVEVGGHTGAIHDVVIAPNSKLLISLGDDRNMRAYLFEEGRSQLLRSFGTEYKDMALSPDGKILALGSEKGKVILLNTSNVDLEFVLMEHRDSPVISIAFHPGKNILAVGFDNGNVELYDISKGMEKPEKLEEELPGHGAGISNIKFSRDGRLLATASLDGTIQLWESDNLNNLPITFSDHGGNYVWDLSFSPDGNYLISGCENGLIKIWPTKIEMLSSQLCDYLGRNMTRAEWERYVGSDVDYEITCESVNRP
ncbi:MAG: High-affnity carbon uptake protein Hat/HatR [Cyclobacteriaceae bacterium]|nr:High-affnity carbon uptake protein Hat/HatR [Cyclobacteriaceae bacterium]